MRLGSGLTHKLVLIFLGFTLFASSTNAATNFLGFRNQQEGIGVTAGWPTLNFRYQTWSTWRKAWYYNLGFDSAGFLVVSVDRAFYFYDVKDRWRETGMWSAAFFYGYLGGMFGLATKADVDSRAGAEAGLGIEYVLPDPTWTVRAELGSSLHAMGKDAVAVHLGVGITYYFDLGEGRNPRGKDEVDDEFSLENDSSGGNEGDEVSLDGSDGSREEKPARKPASKKKSKKKRKSTPQSKE